MMLWSWIVDGLPRGREIAFSSRYIAQNSVTCRFFVSDISPFRTIVLYIPRACAIRDAFDTNDPGVFDDG